MILRRLLTANPSTSVDVVLLGFLSVFAPDQVGVGDVMQGDGTVAVLNDEIVATDWPGPPRARDQMIIAGRSWTVRGCSPVYEREVCIGYSIYVRGS